MNTNIIWNGIEYRSTENCLISPSSNGFEIRSLLVGSYHQKIYRVEYRIITNQNWETRFCEVKGAVNNTAFHYNFESDGAGLWTSLNESLPQFDGCINLDISLTPFTNTLAINRLKLLNGENKEIKLVYFDILEDQVKSAAQKYTRLNDNEYLFQTVPNDFEARINVDKDGLVISYPSLFERSAILNTD